MTILKSLLVGFEVFLATMVISQAGSIFIQWRYIPIGDWASGERAVLLCFGVLFGVVAGGVTAGNIQIEERARKEEARKLAQDLKYQEEIKQSRRAPDAPLKTQRLEEQS